MARPHIADGVAALVGGAVDGVGGAGAPLAVGQGSVRLQGVAAVEQTDGEVESHPLNNASQANHVSQANHAEKHNFINRKIPETNIKSKIFKIIKYLILENVEKIQLIQYFVSG